MSTESTAPCPHCKAENFAHRRECWRCRRPLPTLFSVDAELNPSGIRRGGTGPLPPSRQEILEALDHATIIVDGFEEGARASAQDSSLGKRLVWLLRKRQHLA